MKQCKVTLEKKKIVIHRYSLRAASSYEHNTVRVCLNRLLIPHQCGNTQWIFHLFINTYRLPEGWISAQGGTDGHRV